MDTAYVKWMEDTSYLEGELFCFQKKGWGQFTTPPSSSIPILAKLMYPVLDITSSVSPGVLLEDIFYTNFHKWTFLPALDVVPHLLAG